MWQFAFVINSETKLKNAAVNVTTMIAQSFP